MVTRNETFHILVENRSSRPRQRELDGKREMSITNETFHGGGLTVFQAGAEGDFAEPDALEYCRENIALGTAQGWQEGDWEAHG
ncbi:hypothetical protein [Rhizobium hidalgonense]|uniref:hypothetical protein n=1 Tax=Rhizobium hidalgonense TaxID=1538159 RepID=UPI0012F71BF7|nr:hypothetical protein [Rhizobium hidalgonense]QKK27102.1 hypothetical protein FFM81_028065 [Rhizobium hidalgonense]